MTTLTISGTNLKNNKPFQQTLKASNNFMLVSIYNKLDPDFYIQNWTMINNEGESGNTGMNAGAYLCEYLEELSGLNLA